MPALKRKLPLIIGAILGAGAGYWYYTSCAGGCLITERPLYSILWGAVSGAILGTALAPDIKKT